MNHHRPLRWMHSGAITIALIATTTVSKAQRLSGTPSGEVASRDSRPPSPIPLPRTRPLRPPRDTTPAPSEEESAETVLPLEFRRIDGMENNPLDPYLGAADQPFRRLAEADYADGVGAPSGADRPSPRAISNALCAQKETALNRRGASDFLWQWGQFLDHDIDETPASDPPEAFDIAVPPGDPWFDPQGSGSVEIPLNRSFGEEIEGVRQQVNGITAFIDASNVYGADEERAFALRTLDGTGRLKTSSSEAGDLLPYNLPGLPNAPAATPNFFLAGDVRANEQAGLTAMHTLFVREHNYWADRYTTMNPYASGEETYQFARLIIGAEMQVITYREFLPVLLGPDALPPYRGYRPEVDPSISNVFATAAYRLGHSLLSPTLLRVDADGNEIEAGHLSLAESFFNPALVEDQGIESILRGLATQHCQELDGQLVDEVRNFLFGPPGSGGFDLAALNMQRGRDHGLPSFNDTCRPLGLRAARDFRDLNPDPAVFIPMAEVYEHVDQVDCWIGGLCEPHAEGAMVGPMIHRILVDQFTRLRDGDRFWYENQLAPELIRLVEGQTLARVIRRNTAIGDEIPNNVFLVGEGSVHTAKGTATPRSPSRARLGSSPDRSSTRLERARNSNR